MILLTADWHLTDKPEDEYRWEVVEHVLRAIQNWSISEVFILGDAWDRRDHHSAVLVNRTVVEFCRIADCARLTVLRGNHDTTLRDPSYWNFLNEMDNEISYIVSPMAWSQELILLPFSPNPRQDWADMSLKEFQCAFMHVTYPGALAENGQPLTGTRNLPLFRGKVYSGDVHTPQSFGQFVHVGAPHPVKYGDTYPCRMLLLDDGFNIHREIVLDPPRKHMIDITSVGELARVRVRPGDRVKIRVSCPASAIEGFGDTEAAITQWAANHGVVIGGGIEVNVTGSLQRDMDINQTPQAILKQFAEHERLSDDVLEVGLQLLKEVQ